MQRAVIEPLPPGRLGNVVRALPLIVLPLAALLTVACSEPSRTVDGYCATVQDNLTLVVSPALSTSDDVEITLEAYRAITAVAPAGIEPEWSTLTTSLETASTVVPSDPQSVAVATDAALASTPAATRIQQYTRDICAIDIGTPPPPTNPVTATTVSPTPPPTST